MHLRTYYARFSASIIGSPLLVVKAVVCCEVVVSNNRMVNSCCAFNCSIRDTKVSREAGFKFYRILRKEPKRTLWLNAINRKNFQPRAQTVICSQYFVGGECYYRYSTSGSYIYVAINYNQKKLPFE